MAEESSWKNIIKNYPLLRYNYNQEEYYENAKNIIKYPKISVNQGGMGLGKTLATCLSLSQSSVSHYLAMPFNQLKNGWSKELNFINSPHAIWLSISKCCIYNKSKSCDKECKYRKHLESNKDYNNELCSLLAKNINFPLIPKQYYNKHGYDNCLLPITREKMRSNNIIIGDYVGIFFPEMFNFITGLNQNKTILHIDEGHMLPERIKGVLTKEITITFLCNKIEKYLTDINIFKTKKEIKEIKKYLNVFEEIKKILILKIKRQIEKRYYDSVYECSYNTFTEMWLKLSGEPLEKFIKIADKYSKLGAKNEDIENPKVFTQILNFFTYWNDISKKKEYQKRFQYAIIDDNNNLIIKISAGDFSEFLGTSLKKFLGVHIMSGTIPDEEYFSKVIGVKNCEFTKPITSYSIKNNIIIHPKGCFTTTGGKREKTYETQLQDLISTLNIMKGRKLIYVQAKNWTDKLYHMLKPYFNIFNLNQDSDDDLTKEKEKFNSSGNGVAIAYITGKVEGENFIDKNKNAVENIIIYGYPYPSIGLENRDYLGLWTDKLGCIKKAERFVYYYPASSRIYQAVMRGKRSEDDNPVIILWGDTFNIGDIGYKYLSPELKGSVSSSLIKTKQLIQKIQCKN